VETNHLDISQLVILDDLAKLFLTVGAGSHQVAGTGGADLVGLALATNAGAEVADLVDGHGAAATTAAVVVGATGLHLHVVLAEGAQDLTRLVNDPPSAGHVARVVVRHHVRDDVGVQV